MIELIKADEGTFAMTGQDGIDYVVMRFESCPVYVVLSYSEIEGCLIHGMYNSYLKACDSLYNYAEGLRPDFMPNDNVTDNVMAGTFIFPGGVRDMADYMDYVFKYV